MAFFEPADLERFKNIELWIVDCLRDGPSKAHANVERCFSWIEAAKPQRAILSHMSAGLDYEALKQRCPPATEPGYDGMVISL